MLVPVPSSAPLMKDSLWVPRRIGVELIEQGLADELQPLLKRVRPVARSSGVTHAEHRPSPAQHYASMSVQARLGSFSHITLVDDVVTRGSTLIACASLLTDAYPGVQVKAFALARSDNRVELEDSREMLAPVLGRITFDERSGRLVHSWD